MHPGTIRRWYEAQSSWVKWAIVVWAVLVAGMAIRGVIWPHIHSCYTRFYYPASRQWLAGQDLYQDTADTCRYSPLVHVLLVPFAVLPPRLGGLLWRLFNAALFLGGMAWWLKAVLPPTVTRAQRGLIFLLVIPLAISSL